MSSDLLISIHRRCAFLEIHALDDSVLAEFLLISSTACCIFFSRACSSASAFALSSGIEHREDVELLGLHLCLGCLRIYHMASRHVNSADEKCLVDDAVKEFIHRLDYAFRGRGMLSEILRSMRVLRYGSAHSGLWLPHPCNALFRFASVRFSISYPIVKTI